MADERTQRPGDSEAAAHEGADGEDRIVAALGAIRGVAAAGGDASGEASPARQKEGLREWARGLGLLLNEEEFARRGRRGGMEHDVFESGDRVFKVTRHGVFGLSPGIELALVPSSQDARRFHLWEATPLEYLERLRLHNLLVPGINVLEGVIEQADGDLAIVTSQPRFDIVPVSDAEIGEWFAGQGFVRVADAAYYREADNLGVFDAHDRNVVRAGEFLVPFDVIPCQPAGGFQKFISDTLDAGHKLTAVRSVSPRVVSPGTPDPAQSPGD